MNVIKFDDTLTDSVKLAEAAIVTAQAIGFAEKQLAKIEDAMVSDQSPLAVMACNTGLLEATVEVLIAYLAQIRAIVKPVETPIPGLDDLGDANNEAA